MSSTSTALSSCFICGGACNIITESEETCSRFLILVSRFLDFDFGLLEPAKNTLRCKCATAAGARDECEAIVCDNCFPVAQSFCDMYDLCQLLQLELCRTLDQLTKVIRKEPGSESTPCSVFQNSLPKHVKSKMKGNFPILRLKKTIPSAEVENRCNYAPFEVHSEGAQKECEAVTIVKSETEITFENQDDRDDETNFFETSAVESPPVNIKFKEDDHWDTIGEINETNTTDTEFACAESKIGEIKSAKETVKISRVKTPFPLIINKDNPHNCGYCGKVFTQRSAFVQHQRVHTKEKPFRCDLCSKAFTQAGDLWRHKLRHSGKKPFKCPKCWKCFTDRGVLTTHINVSHSGKRKSFDCEICNKKLSTKICLSNHMRLHGNDKKPFPCKVCGKRLATKVILNRHVELIHVKAKPFVCVVCQKSFALAQYLEVHLRSHTREKPFSCEYCDDCFGELGSLTKHRRRHTGVTPHVCLVCNQKYTQGHSLVKHMRSVHGEKKIEIELNDKHTFYP